MHNIKSKIKQKYNSDIATGKERSYIKEDGILKLTIVIVLSISVVASILYNTDRLYTHFFYVPIAMSSIWRPKWTIPLGICFSIYHIFLEAIVKTQFTFDIIIRAIIILLISIILNEIWKKELNYQSQISTLTYKSCHDSLTKLFNRGYFQWLLSTDLKLPLVLMVIDIDGLKKINDHLGHPAGDEQIIATAQVLTHSLRQGDTLARLGGDEFGIIAQSCTEEGALEIMMRIESLVEKHNRDKNVNQWLSLSVGYESNTSGTCINETLIIADQKMYENKRRKYEVANETVQKNI